MSKQRKETHLEKTVITLAKRRKEVKTSHLKLLVRLLNEELEER